MDEALVTWSSVGPSLPVEAESTEAEVLGRYKLPYTTVRRDLKVYGQFLPSVFKNNLSEK